VTIWGGLTLLFNATVTTLWCVKGISTNAARSCFRYGKFQFGHTVTARTDRYVTRHFGRAVESSALVRWTMLIVICLAIIIVIVARQPPSLKQLTAASGSLVSAAQTAQKPFHRVLRSEHKPDAF
jgi:hypothetical protein